MIQLGVLVLSASMQWAERFTTQSVSQTMKRTLGGKPVLFSGPMSGASITLVASESEGWLTRTQVDALLAMAADPTAVYSLVFGNEPVCSVAFRHHEAPAVEMRPLIPMHEPEVGDYFVGTIKLIKL